MERRRVDFLISSPSHQHRRTTFFAWFSRMERFQTLVLGNGAFPNSNQKMWITRHFPSPPNVFIYLLRDCVRVKCSSTKLPRVRWYHFYMRHQERLRKPTTMVSALSTLPPLLKIRNPETENAYSLMSKSERVVLSCYDRVAIGGELLLFDNPGARPAGVATEGGDGSVEAPVAPTAEFAVEELQAGLRNKGKQAQEVT